MSGGSYDYAYRHVEEFANALRAEAVVCGYEDRELREEFRTHLRKVAKAMRAIEWNDSGDGDDAEQGLIRECLGRWNG